MISLSLSLSLDGDNKCTFASHTQFACYRAWVRYLCLLCFFLHRCHFHPLCCHSFIFSTNANFTVVKFYLRGVNKGMKCVCVHNHRFAFTYRLALDIHPKILTNVLDAYYNFIDKPCLGFTVHEIQQNSFTWSTVQKYLGLYNNCELRAVRVLICDESTFSGWISKYFFSKNSTCVAKIGRNQRVAGSWRLKNMLREAIDFWLHVPTWSLFHCRQIVQAVECWLNFSLSFLWFIFEKLIN